MSLLTPPSTSHRTEKDKENKFPDLPIAGSSTRTVVWAAKDVIHSLATPIKHVSISSKSRPSSAKPILKASSDNFLLELPAVVTRRETTPEPSDPLVDLHYLDHPIEQILSNVDDTEEALANLIQGYNVLAARLRACITESTDADASWPIFQPLRRNSQAFINAVVRDVKRALVDPLSRNTRTGEDATIKLPQYTLPSPATSPTKKKGGLTEEQVKYGRDLCTTCHSVIKLLAVVLSFPAAYNVFDETQLSEVLTAILSIPLADDLPTLNARKTCALTIWLIQVQRLPENVLKPAASRIAYALRRGLDGELGKEGKKGSANDGLKAIHDLCLYLPVVFVPAFVVLLPSVLANLLAPTLPLRTQACHALGGFVNGSAAIPITTIHTKISSIVASFLTTATASPTKSEKSAVKPTEAAIVRTLRATLGNLDPVNVAAGPVWGISVCASFVVLLGPRLSTDLKVSRILSNLLNLGIRHGKSIIRSLTCAAWRVFAWTYFQPPLPVQDDEESEVDEESYMKRKQARLLHCKLMVSVVDFQAGVSSIAALLADDSAMGEEGLRLSISILQVMALKAGHTCQDGVAAMEQMVSGTESSEPWNMKLLLPSKMFSASPGLLTVDFKNLAKPVRGIFDQLAMVHDIRSLTREEMTKDWVFKGMMLAWRTALGCLEMGDGAEIPENFTDVWTNLLKANVSMLEETADDEAISSFACSASKYMVYIMEDTKLNLMPNKPSTSTPTEVAPGSDDTIPEVNGSSIRTNGELRMRVVQRMWAIMRNVFPHHALRDCAEGLVRNLMKNELGLICGTGTTCVVTDEDAIEQTRIAWVTLCVDFLLTCEVHASKMFWGCEDDMAAAVAAGRHYPTWNNCATNIIWKAFTEKWVENNGSWEVGVVLLGVPFTDRHTWGLSSEDYAIWEQVYQHTTSNALDLGIDSPVVLDGIASFVSTLQTPGASPGSSLRLVDLLLSNLEVADMRELPTNVIELTSETLRAMYPPAPRVRHFAMWVVRSLTTVIENCPKDFSLQLLQTIQDGLCVWLSDKEGEWTETEFTYDIITLYQHIILKVQDLPEKFETIETAAPILDSIFLFRTPAPAIESFTDFWNLAYAQVSPPKSGWTGPIRHCLEVTRILPSEDGSACPIFPLASAFVPQPSTPCTPVPATPTAILGHEAVSKIDAPQRPSKVLETFSSNLSTPPSPVNIRRSNSSVRRTPLSAIQLCQTPSKRRRLGTNEDEENKENVLLSVNLFSVTERISALGVPTPQKKRGLEDEGPEIDAQKEEKTDTRPVKRLKGRMRSKPAPVKTDRHSSPAPSTSSNESADERVVEASLTTGVALPSVEDGPGFGGSRRIPQRVRGNGLRPLTTSAPPKQEPSENSGSQWIQNVPTQAKTVPRIDLIKTLRSSISSPDKLHGKRKRMDDDIVSLNMPHLNIRIGPPRRTKRLQYVPLAPDSDADRSYTMSSDDDPHYGQVSPHHLTSPALRHNLGSAEKSSATFTHVPCEDKIPDSDDTVVSSGSSGSDSDSPTKEFLTRYLRRTSSTNSTGKGYASLKKSV